MTIELLTKKKEAIISKYIYGQFSEHLGRGIYGGIYVGKNSDIPNVNGIRQDVVGALRAIRIPVLRWPGGLFADTYHWDDGVGPEETRKKIVNTNWGDVTENNHFGTHEYFELLRQLDCDAYISGNVGSGTVREMAEWIEYMTMPGTSPMADLRRKNGHDQPWKVKFFGVGNETWGGGGNMRPEYYADVYRQYQCFIPQYNKDEKIYKVACGPNEDDYEWTQKIMDIAGKFLDGISLHYYTIPTGDWSDKGDATGFPAEQWYTTLQRAERMEELISKHAMIMDQYDPEHKVDLIVDEWGTWYNVEKGTHRKFLHQQNTIRDALVAAITLNIFHRHADRVFMANIAQTVNVLQAMLFTEGNKMIKTPTYYVFDLYKNHMDAQFVDGIGETPEHTTYTASQRDHKLTITLANYDLEKTRTFDLAAQDHYEEIESARGIFADELDAHNTFDQPDRIQERVFNGAELSDGHLTVSLPAKSVVTLVLK